MGESPASADVGLRSHCAAFSTEPKVVSAAAIAPTTRARRSGFLRGEATRSQPMSKCATRQHDAHRLVECQAADIDQQPEAGRRESPSNSRRSVFAPLLGRDRSARRREPAPGLSSSGCLRKLLCGKHRGFAPMGPIMDPVRSFSLSAASIQATGVRERGECRMRPSPSSRHAGDLAHRAEHESVVRLVALRRRFLQLEMKVGRHGHVDEDVLHRTRRRSCARWDVKRATRLFRSAPVGLGHATTAEREAATT